MWSFSPGYSRDMGIGTCFFVWRSVYDIYTKLSAACHPKFVKPSFFHMWNGVETSDVLQTRSLLSRANTAHRYFRLCSPKIYAQIKQVHRLKLHTQSVWWVYIYTYIPLLHCCYAQYRLYRVAAGNHSAIWVSMGNHSAIWVSTGNHSAIWIAASNHSAICRD